MNSVLRKPPGMNGFRFGIVVTACLALAGCLTSAVYGAPRPSYEVTDVEMSRGDPIEAIAAHWVIHRAYGRDAVLIPTKTLQHGFAWLMARLPEEPGVAPNDFKGAGLAWSVAIECDHYRESVYRWATLITPGDVFYEFVSLETGSSGPRYTLRSGCRRLDRRSLETVYEDGISWPALSLDDWIAAAEHLGMDCNANGLDQAECRADFEASVRITPPDGLGPDGTSDAYFASTTGTAIVALTDMGAPSLSFTETSVRYSSDERPPATDANT